MSGIFRGLRLWGLRVEGLGVRPLGLSGSRVKRFGVEMSMAEGLGFPCEAKD